MLSLRDAHLGRENNLPSHVQSEHRISIYKDLARQKYNTARRKTFFCQLILICCMVLYQWSNLKSNTPEHQLTLPGKAFLFLLRVFTL